MIKIVNVYYSMRVDALKIGECSKERIIIETILKSKTID